MSGGWRIDELGQRAGISVDTIRYYAREGLLTPPVRSGRHKLYGPAHLERLERIRELQEQRFSLAAIRAIVTADRPGLEGIFGGARHAFTLDDLVARSGLDRTLVERLQTVGLLADPAALGRDAYDDNDLALLRAVAELADIGMTDDIISGLGEIYVRNFRSIQAEVHAIFAGDDRNWDSEDLREIQNRLTANAGRMLPAMNRLLNYVHERTVQRLTLEAVREARRDQS